MLVTYGVHRTLDEAELVARMIDRPPAAAVELVLDEIADRGTDNAALAIVEIATTRSTI